jgi:NTP pyrophosphatase (non-canonical NTP hydrolase)
MAPLVEQIRVFNAARGWEKFHNPKNLIMALSCEVGEVGGHFQWLDPEEAATIDRTAAFAEVTDEIADVAIYFLTLVDRLGIDLAASVADKLRQNEARFPVE